METNSFRPGQQLHLKVRGGFVAKGLTLAAWCRDNHVNPTNARSALFGTWNGPKGQALRAKLIAASGIANPPSSTESGSSSA